MPHTRVLVTGCSSGLGLAIALEAARAGCEVIATVRDDESARRLEDRSARLPHPIRVEYLDVRSAPAARELVETVGPVDVLVNNAGVCTAESFYDTSLDVVCDTLETNFLGAVYLIKAVLPAMAELRSGKIINVSSVAGRVALPGLAAYAASKHALEALSETLRLELQGYNVHIVVVEPGIFATRMLERNQPDPRDDLTLVSPFARRFRLQRAALFRLLGSRVGDPQRAARKVVRIMSSDSPRARYRLGADAHLLTLLDRTRTLPLALRLLTPEPRWDERANA